MNEKFAYFETFGCQMNERDSEIMGYLLTEAHYLPTTHIEQADLILVNTCSIRAKAEQKVYSLLGRLKTWKTKRPNRMIVVAGCVAQQEGARIPARMPHVDIVLGTQHIYRLSELVTEAADSFGPVVAVNLAPQFTIPPYMQEIAGQKKAAPSHALEIKKFVTIMQGCNNFCTYCVVPYTRGREISRPPDDIVAEITALAANGIKEVTLLGQNVNSYGKTGARAAVGIDFPALLHRVAAVSGIERIRFTTSHPKDLSRKQMQTFQEIDKLCPHFHLPVQSGSNRVLKRMNRKYTVEAYIDQVNALRSFRHDIALSTDIIVGFPGETDEDFNATMDLLETVRFHSAFSFKYSDRPNAKSASFTNKVSEPEKTDRLKLLQARQDVITLERNREYVGRRLSVMVEGQSKAAAGQMSGRSETNHIVNFDGNGLRPGETVLVTITEGLLHSLRGVLTTPG
jgi:tRNA-2-methylthio-N6-dimethylallyladenosine synthase